MLLTFLPSGISFASGHGEYFRFSNFSTNISDPTQVNSKIVDIVGTFNGVSATSITYQIEHLVNGQVVETARGTGVAPIITDGNTFKFMRVELFQGLNKITVFGTNPSGNQVPGVAYVNFSNVPVLYDIKLVDGRSLEAGEPLVIESSTAVILLKAPNADRVVVNDTLAYSAGEDSWIVSNVPLNVGLNNLSIVASNQTMTYALKRQLVRFNGYPTPYNVAVVNPAADISTEVSLEGNPTVGPNDSVGTLSGVLTGYMVFQQDNTNPTPDIDLDFYDSLGNLTTFQTTTELVSTSPGYTIYRYTATSNVTIGDNGQYTVRVRSIYNNQSGNYPLLFKYRNTDTAYIKEMNQIYNVREIVPEAPPAPAVIVYDSSTELRQNSMIFELPIWVEVKIENDFNLADVTLTTTPNGSSQTSSALVYKKYLIDTGLRKDDGTPIYDAGFRILNLPAGEQSLQVEVVSGGGTEAKTVKVNYIPAPYIQLNNIYNTKVFNSNGTYPTDQANPTKFTTISGRLVNFNNTVGNTDHDTVTVKINGKSVKLAGPNLESPINEAGEFVFIVPNDMKLVNGPNKVTIAGVANGVPVTTELTVYLFSEQVPVITSIKPVPFDAVPLQDDINLKFKQDGQNSYVTNERTADILFTVQNVDSVIVYVDGVESLEAYTDNGVLVSEEPNLMRIDSSDPLTNRYNFRIVNHQLPETGVRSIVIRANLAASSVSQTLTITREISPYMILSPLLPNEKVINQNFLNIAIQAEGADQVLIGKEEARKEANDIFRYEMRDLRAGINKIKFTVVRGTQELDGEFQVNYAGTSTLGAQYKTTIPKGGKIKVFNGEIELELPKGTLLKKANPRPGQQSPSVELFDTQQILFGIADKEDGRTVKKVNIDGNLIDVNPVNIATDLLRVPPHFGHASKMYWIDAGYFNNNSVTQYNTVEGKHPYAGGSEFYNRNFDQWMEPSARGEITLKYDPYIRDGAAVKLSIWKFVDNGWKNLGGVVDVKKKTVTASFGGFGYYAVMNEAYSFNDVVGHPYARNSLEVMFSKGIMVPKNNNEFGVYENITRGEFATMMVKALDIPLEYDPNNMTFDDVPNVAVPGALWDYRYIETAVKKGIIRGMGPRVFAPNSSLTREQAATMIARALNLKEGTDSEKDLSGLQKLFTDANTVDYYAIPSVLAVAKEGIIVGRPNVMQAGDKKPTFRFDPRSFLNRSDAAIIAERVMRKLKKL